MTKRRKPEAIIDMHRQPEGERVAAIGHMVTTHGKRVAFLVDDWPGKADRYIRKLLDAFPGVMCEGPTKGPTAGVVTVIAYPKPEVTHADRR